MRNYMRSSYFFVLLYLTFSGSSSLVPLQMNIKKTFLDALTTTFVEVLARDLPLKEFPDIVDVQDVPDFGFVKFEVKNIKITSFNCSTSHLALEPDGSLLWKLSGMEMMARMTLKVSGKIDPFEMKMENDAVISARRTNFMLKVKLEKGAEGNLAMSTVDCSCKADDVILEFIGEKSFLAGMILENARDYFKSEFEKFVAQWARNHIKEAGDLLPMTLISYDDLEMLMSLIRDPLVTRDGVEMNYNVMIKRPGFKEAATNHSEFQRIEGLPTDSHISVLLSETLFLENLKNMYEQGFLKYEINPIKVTGKLKNFLDAECSSFVCFKSFFNGQTKNLSKGFFDISIEATNMPRCSLRDTKMTLEGKLRLEVKFRSENGDHREPFLSRQNGGQNEVNRFVIQRPERVVDLFTLNFNFSTKLLLSVKNESLNLKLGRFKSSVGPNSIGMTSARMELLLNVVACSASREGFNFNFNVNFIKYLGIASLELFKADSFYQLNFDLGAITNEV